MPEMDQNQFQAALRKYEARKKKQASVEEAKNPPLKPETFKVHNSLPFEPIYQAQPKKDKPAEQERPAPKAMEVSITGPLELKFTIDWSGTLMGGQMNHQSLKILFAKALSSMGRVSFK